MNQPSIDPRDFIHAADELTKQVRRIADALEATAAPAPVEHRSGNAEDCPACSGTNPPYPFLCPGPAPATDEDSLRASRRDSLLVLLSRAERGVLKPHEAELLRNHVEAEVHDGNTARSVAAGNKRHVQTIVPELEQAQAAIERARKLASRWGVLRAYGSAASELRAALDGTEQPTTET